MRWLRGALAALMLAGLAGCAALDASRPPPPTLAEVVRLSREGVAPDEIVRRLRASGAVYRLSGSELAKLREQGVSDKVLDYLQEAQLAQARYEEWLFSHDRYFWNWPYYSLGRYPGPWPYRPYWWYVPPPPPR